MNTRNRFLLITMPLFVMVLMAAGCNKKSDSSKTTQEETRPQSQPIAMTPRVDPPVLIEVDGEQLTREMANKEVDQILANARTPIPPENLPEIRARIIDQSVQRFVVHTILKNETKKANISASPEEVEQMMTKIKANVPKGMTFEEILKKNDISEAKIREDIETDVKVNKLMFGVTNKMAVTDAEVAEYMDKNKESLAFPENVHARHVLVALKENDDNKTKAEKKAKAEKIREELTKEGANFAAIAKEQSDCPSKEMGGDLGRFRRGQMLEPFENAAFSQATNVIGPVVETVAGYHIIQVLEKQTAGTASKEEVKAALLKQKFENETRKYIGSLIQKAKIQDHRPPMDMNPGMMQMPSPGAGQGTAPMPAPMPQPKR